MGEAVLQHVQPALARLARDPADAAALEQLRKALGAFPAAALPETNQLAEALRHVLRGLAEGDVVADAAAVELLTSACSGLAEGEPGKSIQLVERLDAYAAGLGVLPAEAPLAPAAALPPLLTVREDGTRITPGGFESSPDRPPPSRQAVDSESAAAPPRPAEPADIIPALAAAVECLSARVGSLELHAALRLERLAAELRADVGVVAELKDALVEWTKKREAPP